MLLLDNYFNLCIYDDINSRQLWRRSVVFIVNFEHISHLALSVSIINFEQINAGWVSKHTQRYSNGDFKTFLYIQIHIKIIPFKFHILNQKKCRVIFP